MTDDSNIYRDFNCNWTAWGTLTLKYQWHFTYHLAGDFQMFALINWVWCVGGSEFVKRTAPKFD